MRVAGDQRRRRRRRLQRKAERDSSVGANLGVSFALEDEAVAGEERAEGGVVGDGSVVDNEELVRRVARVRMAVPRSRRAVRRLRSTENGKELTSVLPTLLPTCASHRQIEGY